MGSICVKGGGSSVRNINLASSLSAELVEYWSRYQIKVLHKIAISMKDLFQRARQPCEAALGRFFE